jgi:group I intron endonuclease
MNNKAYIGKRESNFSPDYFGSGILIKRAVDKYGKQNFKLEVIVCSNDLSELNKLEKQYIKEFREKFGNHKLYNIADGGDGGWGHIKDNNPRFMVHKGKSNGMYGKQQSQSVKDAVSRANKGRPAWNKGLTKETSEAVKRYSDKIKEVRYVFPLGDENPAKRPEVREKIRISKLGRINSPETREKISKNSGSRRPEVREKIRQAALLRWKNKKLGVH